MKKYELTTEYKLWYGKKLFRIKALKNFGTVRSGDLGGYIENRENLSQENDAWVCDDAQVCGNAQVYGDARVYGDAWVGGNAQVCDDAQVYGDAWVYGDARVCDDARVGGNARVCDDAQVCGNAQVYGDADYICFKGFGSEHRCTTMFKQKDNSVGVKCGCFYGTIAAFGAKVKETHGDSKYAREYLACIEVAKIHFNI